MVIHNQAEAHQVAYKIERVLMDTYRRRGNANRSDPTRGLFWLLAFAGVSCSRGGVATECSRLAPYFLAADQRIALCRQANTAAPADCARKAHAAPRLAGSHILDLCSGEVSDFPGLCVAGLSRSVAKHLSPDLRVELCKGARSEVRRSVGCLSTAAAVLVAPPLPQHHIERAK